MKIPKNDFILVYRDNKTGVVKFSYEGEAKKLLALTYSLLQKIISEIVDEYNKEDLQKMNKELSKCIFDEL